MRRAVAEHPHADHRIVGRVVIRNLRSVIRRHVEMVERLIDAEAGRHSAHLGREVGAVEIVKPRRRHQRAGLAGAAAGIEDAGIRRQAQRHQPGHRVGRGHIAVGVDQVGVVILRPGGVELHQLVGRRVGIGDRDIHILAHARRQPFALLETGLVAGCMGRAGPSGPCGRTGPCLVVSHHHASPPELYLM